LTMRKITANNKKSIITTKSNKSIITTNNKKKSSSTWRDHDHVHFCAKLLVLAMAGLDASGI